MPTAISKDIKDQILARVREGKDTVVEIARQHGLAVNTVYGWISRSVAGADSPLLQAARLKKQNRSLKQIIGNLMLEMEIFDRLNKEMKVNTLIFISHRFSTIKDAERIVVLHQGKVVEDGTHSQLMGNRRRYFDLYTIQAERYKRG